MLLPFTKRSRIFKAHKTAKKTAKLYKCGEHHLSCALVFISKFYPDERIGGQIRGFISGTLKSDINNLDKREKSLQSMLDVKSPAE